MSAERPAAAPGREPSIEIAGRRSPFFLPDASLTLPEVIERRARAAPELAALFDLSLGARATREATSFGALWARASDVAGGLAALGVGAGDRVVIAVGRPSSFAAAIVGTMRLAAIAVPIPPVDGLELPRVIEERMRGVIADASPEVVLADSEAALSIARSVAPGVRALAIDDVHGELGGAPGAPEVALPSPHDVAFLQYTSGSTGSPRGVVVTHASLVANLRAIVEAARFGPEDRCVSWLPLFHDMGLVGGLLLGLYVGAAPHLATPRGFLSRPVSWLEAMDRFRATFTVAPNFAYALIAHRVPESALAGLDLGAIRLCFDGAEPIDRATLEAFSRKLAPAGLRSSAMYPVYGLAEATLAASFPEPGRPARVDVVDREVLASEGRALPVDPGDPRALAIASLGRGMPGHSLAVVDPITREALPERRVGEVVLDGPSISVGYHGRPPSARPLATGDLGYLADGELHVVDRLKDLVIVAGRNLAPSDVERAASSIAGIVPGAIAAFGVPGPEGTDALAVLAAIHPSTWRTGEALRAEIAHAIQERTGVRPARVWLVGPGDVPRTSSGKIRRAECRALAIRSELREVDGLGARARIKLERMRRRMVGALSEISTKGRRGRSGEGTR